jgi:hypothetical protein
MIGKTVQHSNMDFSVRTTLHLKSNFSVWKVYGNDSYDSNDDIYLRSLTKVLIKYLL